MIDVTEAGDVGVITVDDGKANGLSFELIPTLTEAIGKQAATSKALVLAGRPGLFCAGLDMAVVKSGDPDRLTALFDTCTDLYTTVLRSPVPIVAACTGHAVAGGALLLLCCDYRIGLQGDYRIGLHEVSIGLPYPKFGSRVAQLRLNRARYFRATVLAEVTGPDEAVEVGFLDEVVDRDVTAAAIAKAQALSPLVGPAYATAKHIAYTAYTALDDL
jgi:enoyl-CoA hydratase